MNLSGHTVLITGGASGIGLALAEQFIKHENKVIVVGRNESKLSKLKVRFPVIHTIACDVGVEDEVERLARRIHEEHPDVSVLVNNAGIQHNYDFTKIALHEAVGKIEEEVDINLTAPIKLTVRLLPLLACHGEAAIVNVSSALGIVPKQSAPVYCATKGGLHLFTKALRYQLESTSVKVFEIIPSLVDTDMSRQRGSGKMSAEKLAAEFWQAYRRNRLEVAIGKAKLLRAPVRIGGCKETPFRCKAIPARNGGCKETPFRCSAIPARNGGSNETWFRCRAIPA